MNFLFFRGQRLIHFLDAPVCQLLQIVAPGPLFVLRQISVAFHPFEFIHAVSTDISDRYPRLFGVFMGNLHQLRPAFLTQLWNWDPDHVAVTGRVKTKPRFQDRFFNQGNQPLIHTWTVSMRASGTPMVPTCFIGILEP